MIFVHALMTVFSVLFMKYIGYDVTSFETICVFLATNIHFFVGWVEGSKMREEV